MAKTEAVKISFDKPIGAVGVLSADDSSSALGEQAPSGPEQSRASPEMDSQLTAACEALKRAAAELSQSRAALATRARQQTAELAVRIAEMLVRQEIDKGRYNIEEIVTGALQNAPASEKVTLRLNPADVNTLNEFTESNPQHPAGQSLSQVKLLADAGVNRAECVVETPRGVIESQIETQLQRIAEALQSAE